MKFLNEWWGINENIAPLEIAARSAVMFIIALVLIRIAGMRPFGKGEGFDKIITFLIGAILSRGVVGATPFFSTVVSVIVIIIVHKILAKLSIYNKWFGDKVKGSPIMLYRDGRFLEEHMHKTNLTKHDVLEELRLQCQKESLEKVDAILMELTGEVSFLMKENKQ